MTQLIRRASVIAATSVAALLLSQAGIALVGSAAYASTVSSAPAAFTAGSAFVDSALVTVASVAGSGTLTATSTTSKASTTSTATPAAKLAAAKKAAAARRAAAAKAAAARKAAAAKKAAARKAAAKKPVTVPTKVPVKAPVQRPASVVPSAIEAQIVALTNQQRAANGCGALRTDGALTAAARAHSADQAAHKAMTHTGTDGSDFVTRALRAGYKNASAENVAWGYRTADAVMTGWMNSAGHRANIVNCSSVAVGVGVATAADGTPYYTQDFGRV